MSKSLGSRVVLAILALVLWGYVVGPMGYTIRETFRTDTGSPFRDWIRFFDRKDSAQIDAMIGSIEVSFLSVITAGVTGVFLAVLFHRWDFPLRNVCRVVVLVPFALPPLIGAEAFVLLYGIGGILPRLLERLLHAPPNTLYVSGMAGVLLVHTLTMYPFFYLIAAASLMQSDDSLEEAAYSLGATTARVWRRVLFPMLTPAMVSGALLTFMSSMASLTAPMAFDFDQVMTRQIVLARQNARTYTDFSFASVIAVVLAAVSVLFLIVLRSYEGRHSYRSQSKGGARKRRRVAQPLARVLAFVVALVSIGFLILPIGVIFVMAFAQNGSWGPNNLLPARYGLENFAGFFSGSALWQPAKNSLVMSTIAVAGTIVLGTACAYVITRMRFRGRTAIDIAIMLPWALPGTVVAVNLLTAFAKPSLFGFGRALIVTYPIVPLAYFVRFSPLVFRSTTASLEQIDPALEDAARSLGGSWLYAFRRVVLPLLYRGIAAGALLAFVGGIGEYVATTLLQSPDYPVFSTAIEQYLYHSASTGFGKAYALGAIQVLLVGLVLIVSGRIERSNKVIGIS
jgi:iron(III) transport system permease protein